MAGGDVALQMVENLRDHALEVVDPLA